MARQRYEDWRGQYLQGVERARSELALFVEEAIQKTQIDVLEQVGKEQQKKSQSPKRRYTSPKR